MNYRRPPHLAFTIWEDEDVPATYLFPLPHGPVSQLDGTAALIWALAVEGEPDIAAAVADLVDGADAEGIRADVDDYLRYLVGMGFLEEMS